MQDKDSKKITGLKKRQQIAKANKAVFLWVAGAAVVTSLGVAVGQSLLTQALFNQKVISEKTKTSQTLNTNLQTSKELKNSVNQLLANRDLLKARTTTNDSALKVVLDALPTADEPLAFGSSLQLVLLPKGGVAVDSISVGADQSLAVADPAATGSAAPVQNGPAQIPFTFSATGNLTQIRETLTVLERSIRPISLTSVIIEGSDAQLKLTVSGFTSYQSAKTVELQKKAVSP